MQGIFHTKVRQWIRTLNKQAVVWWRNTVFSLSCLLKSLVEPIEPKWVHSKRAIEHSQTANRSERAGFVIILLWILELLNDLGSSSLLSEFSMKLNTDCQSWTLIKEMMTTKAVVLRVVMTFY